MGNENDLGLFEASMIRMFRTFCVRAMIAVILASCTESSSHIPLADDSPRDTALVSDVLSCAKCLLKVMDSVVLGAPSDSLVPIRNVEFARDSRGNVYLFTDGGNLPVLHYDSAGHFRGRLGRVGEGPGEYRAVSRVVVGPADSLFLIEPAGVVIHVFAPNDSFARRISVPKGGWVSEIAKSGPALLYGMSVSRDGAAMDRKLLRFKANAQILDSVTLFAPPSGTKITIGAVDDIGGKQESLQIDLNLESNVFPAPGGAFWALSDGNYRLEQYDSTGTPRKLFGVLTAGEPPPVMTVAEAREAVAKGRKMDPLGGVHSTKSKYQFQVHRWVDVDSNGLLWVTRQVAAPSWDTVSYREIKTNTDFGPEAMIPPEIFDRLSHTVVEIIDPTNGRMLARHTLPFRAMRVQPGYFGRVTANADGYLVPIVYRIQLQRQ